MNKRAIFSKSLLTSGHDFPKLAPVPARQERQFGEVSEWLKEHAWKVCIRQRIGGSNPPLTAIFKEELVRRYGLFFSYIAHTGGMRSPDRGSTTGAASWTDHEHSEWAARRASEASQSPPSPSYLKKSAYESTSFFRILSACSTVNQQRSNSSLSTNF